MKYSIYKYLGYSLIILFLMNTGCEPKKGGVENKETTVSAKEVVHNSATAATSSGTLSNSEAPKFAFKDTIKNFGTIKEGDVASYVFSFKNVGKSPLIISNASATCGCTVPRWPKEPIVSGDTASIFVSFNSRGKPGTQAKTITITSNTEPSIHKLTIIAEVEKAPVKNPEAN